MYIQWTGVYLKNVLVCLADRYTIIKPVDNPRGWWYLKNRISLWICSSYNFAKHIFDDRVGKSDSKISISRSVLSSSPRRTKRGERSPVSQGMAGIGTLLSVSGLVLQLQKVDRCTRRAANWYRPQFCPVCCGGRHTTGYKKAYALRWRNWGRGRVANNVERQNFHFPLLFLPSLVIFINLPFPRYVRLCTRGAKRIYIYIDHNWA